jgi:hypothetical protein
LQFQFTTPVNLSELHADFIGYLQTCPILWVVTRPPHLQCWLTNARAQTDVLVRAAILRTE